MSRIASIGHHLHEHRILTLSAIASIHRACVIIYLLYLQPLVLPTSSHFDTSASLLDLPQWIWPLVRWDVLHYTSISIHGYRYEHELAFLPGWPAAIRTVAAGWRWLYGAGNGMVEVVLAGVALSNAATVLSTSLLYSIILQLSSSSTASRAALQSSQTPRYPASRDLAFIASLLYILSPSPATVASGYTEAPFAALTFTGILCLVHLTNAPDRERWRKVLCGVCATLAFTAATTLRSLGVLNAGMVGWLGVVLPIWNLFTARSHGISMSLIGTIIPSIISCIVITSPFLVVQVIAHRDFCIGATQGVTRPWCNSRLPFAYGFIQSEYWGSGFLLYWTPAQIPNFALAMPVICACLVGCWEGVRNIWTIGSLETSTNGPQRQNKAGTSQDISSANISHLQTIAAHPIFVPLLITHTLTTLILLFNSHVQIVLRVVQTMPVLWMVVGGWVCDTLNGGGLTGKGKPNWGKWWMIWSVMWHGVGLVLWGAFLPPA